MVHESHSRHATTPPLCPASPAFCTAAPAPHLEQQAQLGLGGGGDDVGEHALLLHNDLEHVGHLQMIRDSGGRDVRGCAGGVAGVGGEAGGVRGWGRGDEGRCAGKRRARAAAAASPSLSVAEPNPGPEQQHRCVYSCAKNNALAVQPRPAAWAPANTTPWPTPRPPPCPHHAAGVAQRVLLANVVSDQLLVGGVVKGGAQVAGGEHLALACRGKMGVGGGRAADEYNAGASCPRLQRE